MNSGGIYSVKSKWTGHSLAWLVLRGAATIAVKNTEREAHMTVAALKKANDPWQAFENARQLANRGA